MSHVRFMLDAGVDDPAFAERVQHESAEIQMAVAAKVHRVAGLDADHHRIRFPGASQGRAFGPAEIAVQRQFPEIETSPTVVVPEQVQCLAALAATFQRAEPEPTEGRYIVLTCQPEMLGLGNP